MSPSERRRIPRIKKAFMARYRVQDQDDWMLSPLKDVCRHGLRFLCEREFGVGTVLNIELILPVVKEPVAITAKVVRVNKAPLGLFEHAFAFEALDPASDQAIGEAIEHLLKKQGGDS